MNDHSLVLLLDQVRGKTLDLLQGVSMREALWTPAGLHNSILWHSGHCYVLVEWLTINAVGGQPQIPADWFELFSWQSRPSETPLDRWPPLADVAGELQSQHLRLRGVVSGLTPEELARPGPENPDRTARYLILHGLHDEACHGGEIWLLRKLQHAGWAVWKDKPGR